MDPRSVLGLPAVRPALLDDVSPACPAEAETRGGTDDMTLVAAHDHRNPPPMWFGDEIDDDADDEFDDEFDDNDNDEDDEDDADEDGDDEEEPETWQVHGWFAVKT